MTTQQSFLDVWSETSDGEKSCFVSVSSAMDKPRALSSTTVSAGEQSGEG
jgi:hypothetical protein